MKVNRLRFIKIKSIQDSLIVAINFATGIHGDKHTYECRFPMQYKPDTQDDAADGTGQTNAKYGKYRLSFFIQSIGRCHHAAIRSSQCHSRSQHGQSRCVRHHHHVATKGRHNHDVIQKFQNSSKHGQVALSPCFGGRRLEFDKHGNVQSGQHGRLRPHRHCERTSVSG